MTLPNHLPWLVIAASTDSPHDAPLACLVGMVTLYWSTILGLALYKRLRFGQSAGLWPRKAKERRLWLLVGPVVIAWITLPWLAWSSIDHFLLTLPAEWTAAWPMLMLRWIAVGLAMVFYVFSACCWLQMGRNWSMAIVPKQKTELVTRGFYAWIRHPIYAFSLGLMVCSVVILPTWPMLIVAILHFVGLNRKAAVEETYLRQQFGPTYEHYCQQVGRFFLKPYWTYKTMKSATPSPTR